MPPSGRLRRLFHHAALAQRPLPPGRRPHPHLLTITDHPVAYHPWQPEAYTDTEPDVILPPDTVPAVPAHDLPHAAALDRRPISAVQSRLRTVPHRMISLPPNEGEAVVPPEAEAFDLTAITLQAETETLTLVPDHRTTDRPDPW